MSSKAAETVALKAKDLTDRLIEVLKSSGETSATKQFVVSCDGVVYTATIKLETRREG